MNPAAISSGSPRISRTYLIISLFGLVALFGDVIYEGARSVTGPYLLILGGSAVVVGFVAGAGEFIGYALRLISGFVADSTRHYWPLIFLGYGLLIAVPLLAFAGSWEAAALLFITERVGKGIRAPAKDAVLSNITVDIGRGWGFGIHEAFDQIGAILGPLIFTAAFLFHGDYRSGFSLLIVPFILMFIILILLRMYLPDPVTYEVRSGPASQTPSRKFLILYGLFTALTVGGFVSFPLISFHMSSAGIVPDAQIPLFYAIAMGVDAVVALAGGRLYDRKGPVVMALMPVTAVIIPLFAFSSSYSAVLLSAILWGVVLGFQETVLRAVIADYTHLSKRGRAYGIFNTVYGGSWFAGSAITGWLYTISPLLITVYVAAMQILSIPALLGAIRKLECTGS
ncbi:MAG: MFS transporter [Methanoculleaceae archaeon]